LPYTAVVDIAWDRFGEDVVDCGFQLRPVRTVFRLCRGMGSRSYDGIADRLEKSRPDVVDFGVDLGAGAIRHRSNCAFQCCMTAEPGSTNCFEFGLQFKHLRDGFADCTCLREILHSAQHDERLLVLHLPLHSVRFSQCSRGFNKRIPFF
jgi:hypothetical protein